MILLIFIIRQKNTAANGIVRGGFFFVCFFLLGFYLIIFLSEFLIIFSQGRCCLFLCPAIREWDFSSFRTDNLYRILLYALR